MVIDELGYLVTGSAEPQATWITTKIAWFSRELNSSLKAGTGLELADVVDSGDTEDLYNALQHHLVTRTAGEWHKANQRRITEYYTEQVRVWELFLQGLKEHPQIKTGGQAGTFLPWTTRTVPVWPDEEHGYG